MIRSIKIVLMMRYNKQTILKKKMEKKGKKRKNIKKGRKLKK